MGGPVDVIANAATGGLYGAATAGVDALSGQGSLLGGLNAGLQQLGPFGGTVYPISPQAATAGNALGAGVGLGAGLVGATDASPLAGADLGYGPMVGVSETGEPLYLMKTASGVSEMTAEQAQAAGLRSTIIGGSAGAGTSGATGALLGAGAGQHAVGMLEAMLARPVGLPPVGSGRSPSTLTGLQGQGLTPQQLAALSATASQAHQGLAPRYAQRMSGQNEDPGLAADFAALQQAQGLG